MTVCRCLRIVAFAVVFFLSAQSWAQTIDNLATGGSASLDGLTFTISGCTSLSTPGLCNNVEMKLTDAKNSVTAQFLGNGGAYGSNALSVSNSSLQYFYFTLNVTSSRAVTAVSDSVSGYGYNNSSLNNAPGSGCTTTGGRNTGLYCTAYAFNYPGNSANPASNAFPGQTNLNLTYTLGIQGTGTQTLVLNSASALFTDIPEPRGVVVMLAGVAGLFASRYRRRAPPPVPARRPMVSGSVPKAV